MGPDGPLGAGSTAGSPSTAVAVTGLTGATDIAASDDATCVVYGASDQVACWGDNSSDAIGDAGATGSVVTTYADLTGVSGVSSLVMGADYGCALIGQHVQCWGANGSGQYGEGDTVSAHVPVEVTGLRRAADVGVYGNFACGRTTGGSVACWGDNGNGQLGQGTTGGTEYTPQQVSSLTAVSVDAEQYQVCAVEPAGTVQCWGDVYDSSAGSRVTTPTPTPLHEADGTTPVSGILRVRSSRRNTCFLHDDGTLSCMGVRRVRRARERVEADSYGVPVTVSGLSDVRAFDVDDGHACAVGTDGHAYCWGSDFHYALGMSGSSGSGRYSAPQLVRFYDDIVDVRVGDGFTCVLRATGDLACWGLLISGVSETPVPVTGLIDGRITSWDAESDSLCVRIDVPPPTPSQPVLCWNSANVDGQMGVGTQLPVSDPTEVLDYTDFDDVITGAISTCAVRDSRQSLTCWGNGSVLGDGSGTLSTEPVPVIDFP